MVSAGVLGIALMGLVQMHTTSIRGAARTDEVARGWELSRQMADRFAIPTADLGCGDASLPLGEGGCMEGRIDPGDEKGWPCTMYVDGDATSNDASGDFPESTQDAFDSGRAFRIDRWLSAHPSGGDGVSMLHVWVCWRRADGTLQEVYSSRVRVEDLW